ncbi:pentapeptide repeat-containing protein [Bradyrhizobium sp. LTSPM299]|uniref:pentapeptide repeat-containing protein n=1 Tax=Bradyrhizobium sp. LTSPM299 TaxID=1619233 RepID=UPI000679C561|nr:pentapeptide repeat-containing protein [Bradyrhizobium sp. LTSPM299]
MPSKQSDIDDLQKSLSDNAGKTSIIWTTLVTFELYLAISFGSVTHRKLFLESPLQLPLLNNVELPLTGFFVVAPALLLVFWIYVILHFLILGEKLAAFRRVSGRSETQRQRLDSFFFIQLINGPRAQQRGFVRLALFMVSGLTLVAVPILILVQAEVIFLPYQSDAVTWWHRSCILIGLAIALFFCSKTIASKAPETLFERLRRVGLFALLLSGTAGVLFFSYSVVTFPGETWRLAGTTYRPTDWPADHLILSDQKFEETDGAHPGYSGLVFRGRRLQEIELSRAKLNKADFTRADLSNAVLEGADLQNSNFFASGLAGAKLSMANLKDAFFYQADLRRTVLMNAWAENASFTFADLSRSEMTHFVAPGARFTGAFLQRALLYDAVLYGAQFDNAHMEFAELRNAELQGANFDDADLVGTNFNYSNLDGANLRSAKLQGAGLDHASLKAANMTGAATWRFRGSPFLEFTKLTALNPSNPPWDFAYSCTRTYVGPFSTMNSTPDCTTFEKWKTFMLESFGPNDLWDRPDHVDFDLLDPSNKPKEDAGDPMLFLWKRRATLKAEQSDEYREFVLNLACGIGFAPFGLNGRVRNPSSTPALARAFLYSDTLDSGVRRAVAESIIQGHHGSTECDLRSLFKEDELRFAKQTVEGGELFPRDRDALVRNQALEYAVSVKKDSTAFLNRAKELLARGQYDQAISNVTTAIGKSPSSEAYEMRARAKSAKGDIDGAIADFSLSINDTSPLVFQVERGEEYLRKPELEAARRDFQAVVKLQPQTFLGFYLAGLVEFLSTDPGSATAMFDKAIANKPDFVEAKLYRGISRLLKGDTSGAVSDLSDAYTLDRGAYAAIWRYFAQQRAGSDGSLGLREAALRMNGDEELYPAMDFLLGLATDEEFAATGLGKPLQCEFELHIAEAHIIKNDRATAAELLKKLISHCAPTNSAIAKMELQAISSGH